MKRLSDAQVNLLCTLLPQPLTASHAAFQVGTSPQAVGRIMGGLCRRGLAYYDLLSGGEKLSYVVSEKGVQWVLDNRARVEKVEREMGFTNEKIASIFTLRGCAG